MGDFETATPNRVQSNDGTEIQYWSSGTGTPLVLVHGTASLHTTWNAVLPHLQRFFTIAAIDRRGRGGSGDHAEYDVIREYEDVAAVVDSLAAASGEKVGLVGHSFGGLCAFGAATLTSQVNKLVLYEGWPGMGSPNQPGWIEIADRLSDMLASGDRNGVLEAFFSEVAGIPVEEIAALRAVPDWWEARVAAAHTILREYRVEAPFSSEIANSLAIPTLILIGGESPMELTAGHQALAEALHDAKVSVIPGQQHIAHFLAPEVFAALIVEFLDG
jgi:pimeloyl-ACP methyl ester carboxylesterase